jgi:hypothetical protein
MFSNFLVEHDISFHIADHASKLFRAIFPDSKIAAKFRCARTKLTAIVKEILGPMNHLKVSAQWIGSYQYQSFTSKSFSHSYYIIQQTIEAMKESPFSLLMDETTDIGCQKQAAMLVKVWKGSGVKTMFYDMKVRYRLYYICCLEYQDSM